MYADEDYLSAVFTAERGERLDYYQVEAKLNLYDKFGENFETVGSASIYTFNGYMVDSWDDLLNSEDAASGDVLEVVDFLSKSGASEEIYGLIAVLDRLEISEGHGNKGYSDAFLDEITNYLEFLNFNYMCLIPEMIDDGDAMTEGEPDISYYISKGFKLLASKMGGRYEVMGKSLLLGMFE